MEGEDIYSVLLQARSMTSLLCLAAFFAFFAFLYYGLVSQKSQRLPLPPGPKTSMFGSVDLPKTYPWKTYAQWKKTYGDVIYIHVFGNPIIVLNSAKAATELLDKRSSIYSSRPQRTMVSELMGWDWLFSTVPYGTWWKRHRTLFHQYLNANTTPNYHPIQTDETHVMLKNLAATPDNFLHHVRRTGAAIVVKAMYGHQVAPEGDAFVALADKALASLAQSGIFGTYLVDYIPLLKYVPAWIPGAGFKHQASEWRKLNRAMLSQPIEMVKQDMARGAAVSCFATTELEKWYNSGQDPDQERIIKDVAATTYAAGADTSVSAVQSFFLAVTVYPNVLKKAQAEIDRVVGSDRLPTFNDRMSLPCIDWIVWECLRWNPVTPLGLAHSTTEDDVYEGYHIPKGTTVLPNVWNILHDEATYPDPFAFNPDRYADAKTNTERGINDVPWAAFGFGRRMCPGRWLAIDTIWIAVATAAAVFDISAPLDAEGRPVQQTVEYTSTLLSRPHPFHCRIAPRSEAAAALIEQCTQT